MTEKTTLADVFDSLLASPSEHPDLPLQQEAARRLGLESKDLSVYAFNAMLMNRIADLEERLEAHEKASKGP